MSGKTLSAVDPAVVRKKGCDVLVLKFFFFNLDKVSNYKLSAFDRIERTEARKQRNRFSCLNINWCLIKNIVIGLGAWEPYIITNVCVYVQWLFHAFFLKFKWGFFSLKFWYVDDFIRFQQNHNVIILN